MKELDGMIFDRASDDLVRTCFAAVLRGEKLTPGELAELGVPVPPRSIVLDDFIFEEAALLISAGAIKGARRCDEYPVGPDRVWVRRWIASNAAEYAKQHPEYFSEYAALIAGDEQPALQLFARPHQITSV